MVPADALERAPAIGHENGLVAQLAEVTRAIAAEQLKNLLRAGAANQTADGRIGRGLVPILQRVCERLFGFFRRRHFQFVHGTHRPIAFLHVLRL